MIQALLQILGLAGGTVANKATGALSHLALLPVGAWLLAHHEDRINFDTSLGFLGLATLVLWAIFEIARRSNPQRGGE